MSSCDCDRKTSNGGNCDSSCKEESYFVVENNSVVSYAPVVSGKAPAAESVAAVQGFSAAADPECL